MRPPWINAEALYEEPFPRRIDIKLYIPSAPAVRCRPSRGRADVAVPTTHEEAGRDLMSLPASWSSCGLAVWLQGRCDQGDCEPGAVDQTDCEDADQIGASGGLHRRSLSYGACCGVHWFGQFRVEVLFVPLSTCWTTLSVHWNDVGVSKPIPFNNFADGDRDGFWKHWTAHDDCVDFSVLSAWVAILWEFRNQLS